MNDKEKPLAEIDSLRLENLKLKADLISTIAARDALQAKLQAQELMREFNAKVQEIANAEGLRGWQLDWQNKKWVAPSEDK